MPDQTSHGDQSPNINSGGGPVNVTYGVPQKVVDRLNELLDAKDIALTDRDAQLAELTSKYQELQAQLAERDDEVAVRARKLLADGQLDEAEALLKASLAERLKRLDEDRELAAADAFEIGGIRLLNLDYSEARDYYAQAVELSPRNSLYLNELGVIEDRLANHQRAISHYEQALSIDLEVYGERHPQVAIFLNNLGEVWRKLGEYQKAIDYYEQALSIDREVYGERHPDVARDLNNLGLAWKSLGEYQKAIDYYEQALSIVEGFLGTDHPNTLTTVNNIKQARARMADEGF